MSLKYLNVGPSGLVELKTKSFRVIINGHVPQLSIHRLETLKISTTN